MEHKALVIDTSVFIEYLRAKNKKETILFRLPSNVLLYVSAITVYELLMGATTDGKLNDVKLLTEDLTDLPFTETTAFHAASLYHELRKSNKMIEFRDIFIAAACLEYNLPLRTNNKKDFNRIKGLKLA